MIVGTLALIVAVGYLTLSRSSPGDLARVHAEVAGSSFITACNKCHSSQGLDAGCLGCHHEIKEQLEFKKGFHFFVLKDGPVACATCHSEHNGTNFELINAVSWRKEDPRKFTHPHVTFRLKGKHLGLACEKCHNAAPPFSLKKFPNKKRTHTYLGLRQVCSDCHKDPHAGGASPDCARCHSQEAWRPAPLFNHDKFYPLRNGHARVNCQKCHPVPDRPLEAVRKGWVPFRGALGKKCEDCHKSPHHVTWNRACLACHDKDARPWSTALVRTTPQDHDVTGFRLGVPHQKVGCQKCHFGSAFAQRYPNPMAPDHQRKQNRCEACHRDEHRGQFLKKYPQCQSCHSPIGFRPSKFTSKNHGVWPLMGAHQKTSCGKCHTRGRLMEAVRYIGTPLACSACHRDVHRGQLSESGETRCDKCHLSAVTWKTLSFDHNRQSSFPLDKAHVHVACGECHPKARAKDGTVLTFYKPLKHMCKDCHDFE